MRHLFVTQAAILNQVMLTKYMTMNISEHRTVLHISIPLRVSALQSVQFVLNVFCKDPIVSKLQCNIELYRASLHLHELVHCRWVEEVTQVSDQL